LPNHVRSANPGEKAQKAKKNADGMKDGSK
jgi:hypothetical protein